MKNITITLDEQTAEAARKEAAAKGVSLSRYIGELLQNQLPASQRYKAAMERWLSLDRSVPLTKPGERLPTRDEIYDRPVLRRR